MKSFRFEIANVTLGFHMYYLSLIDLMHPQKRSYKFITYTTGEIVFLNFLLFSRSSEILRAINHYDAFFQNVKGLYPPNFFKKIIFGFLLFFDTLNYRKSPYVIYFCCLELFMLLFFITKLTV